jgi:uncharacterized protein (DUF58 family)
MLTTRGLATVGGGAALLALWWTLGDRELLLAAGFLLIAAGSAVAYSVARNPQLRIVRRLTPAVVHAGDEAKINLVLDNVGDTTATGVRLLDTVDGLGTAQFEVASLDRGQRTEATYRVLCRARGVYRVGPALVATSDPLRLAETPGGPGPVDRLVVFPKVERLRGFPLVRGEDPAMDAARPEHGRSGGEDFYTLREYQMGDDLRRVHWPSSAKTEKLMIRQMETPWRSRALVILDIRPSAYESSEAFEKAVSGAASVISHLVGSGFDADLWSGDHRPVDTTRYSAAMERLAMATADDTIDLVAATGELRRKGGGGALVLITGSPDDDLLTVHELLKVDYPATLLMTVASTRSQTLGRLLRRGVLSVGITPEDNWAEAWMTATDRSWIAASR